MFYEADTVVSVDFSNYEVYTAGGFKTDSLFYRCSNLKSVKGLGRFLNDMFDYGLHTHSIGGLFQYCSSLTDVGDLNDFDISIFDSILCAFQGCSSIKTLDLSKWNTSNATNMNRVFQGCSSLENLYIDKFDTSSVEYSSSYGYYVIDMFKDCTALKKIRCTQSFKDYCI